MKKNESKMILVMFVALGLLVTVIGLTYAFFSYSANGSKENTITSGDVVFHYSEDSQGLDLDEMLPMTDSQGMGQTDYFDFTITSRTPRTLDIPYYITVRRTNSSEASMDNIVKVYLTKVTGEGQNEQETQVALSTVGSLNQYTNSSINLPAYEKQLYTDSVLAGTSNYTQKYRLRMWISNDAEFVVQTPVAAYCERNSDHETVTEINSEPATITNCTGDDYTWHPADVQTTYPYENKTYSITVNVYSFGSDITESEKAVRENTNLSSVALDSSVLTSDSNGNYTTTYETPNNTAITKNIIIETENPNATVTVQSLTAAGDVVKDNGIKRMSVTTYHPVELSVGTNNFNIVVTSADRTKTDTYSLTIVVSVIPDPVSFSTDSWKTIAKAVYNNDWSAYSVGQTKTIDMGDTFGTQTIRIVNTTACTNESSESACGLVFEFVNILGKTTNNTSTGGYPASTLQSYLVNTVYPALPEDLKSVIAETTIDSLDFDHTTVLTSQEKLYLLDAKEVYGAGQAHHSTGTTRQLDYYSGISDAAKMKTYNSVNTDWWLRSGANANGAGFYYVSTNNGGCGFAVGGYNFGISPAFKVSL